MSPSPSLLFSTPRQQPGRSPTATPRSIVDDRDAPASPVWLRPVLILVLGTALGLWTTATVLMRRFDPAAVTNGPWTTWPNVGTLDIDPYARAVQARSGEIAIAGAEGIMFVADRDSAGAPLAGGCTYRIAGPVPKARLWTLGLATSAGEPIDDPAHRPSFTSTEILRRDDGGFTIEVAPILHPGNWLPDPPNGPFLLILRLYETPLAATPAELGTVAMPAIARLRCGG